MSYFEQVQDQIDDGMGNGLVHDVDAIQDDVQALKDTFEHLVERSNEHTAKIWENHLATDEIVNDLRAGIDQIGSSVAKLTIAAEKADLRHAGLFEIVTQLMVAMHTGKPMRSGELGWDDPKVIDIARAIAERNA